MNPGSILILKDNISRNEDSSQIANRLTKIKLS